MTGKTDFENEQPVKGFVGITGKTCDWDIAADLVKKSRIPVILAGGIIALVVNGYYAGHLPLFGHGIRNCPGNVSLHGSQFPAKSED